MDQSKRERRSVPKAPERARRRRYTTAQKLAIVRECLVPGASLAGVAMAHQANANMVRKWVVKFRRGGFGEAADSGVALLPVAVRKPVRRKGRGEERCPDRDLGDRNATGRGALLRSAQSGAVEPVHHRADRSMIGLPLGTRVWIAAGVTDMRKGMDGLAALVQTALGEQSVLGRRVRVSRQARRSGEAAVVERRRDEPVREAPGARPLRVAAGDQRGRASDCCATVDVARRHRLAAPGAHLAAGASRREQQCDGDVLRDALLRVHRDSRSAYIRGMALAHRSTAG